MPSVDENPSTDELSVWWLEVDALTDAELALRVRSLLQPEELERCARFRFESDRRRCSLARLLRREVLSRYADVLPEHWRFGVTAHGKPFILHPAEQSTLDFNISHGGDLVVCAVSRMGRVGVDVESFEQASSIELVQETILTPEEQSSLDALQPAERRQRLLEYWTLKEAFTKAVGLGLSLSPRSFSFAFDTPITAQPTLRTAPASLGVANGWQFHLQQLRRHQLAVAVQHNRAATVIVRQCSLAGRP